MRGSDLHEGRGHGHVLAVGREEGGVGLEALHVAEYVIPTAHIIATTHPTSAQNNPGVLLHP